MYLPLNARLSGYLDLDWSICPFLHFFHDAGLLRSGFFVVPLFVPFWLRIFEIFIELIQYAYENIPKYVTKGTSYKYKPK